MRRLNIPQSGTCTICLPAPQIIYAKYTQQHRRPWAMRRVNLPHSVASITPSCGLEIIVSLLSTRTRTLHITTAVWLPSCLYVSFFVAGSVAAAAEAAAAARRSRWRPRPLARAAGGMQGYAGLCGLMRPTAAPLFCSQTASEYSTCSGRRDVTIISSRRVQCNAVCDRCKMRGDRTS